MLFTKQQFKTSVVREMIHRFCNGNADGYKVNDKGKVIEVVCSVCKQFGFQFSVCVVIDENDHH